MTDCTANRVEFGKLGRRKLEVNFGGGAVSSDGGLLLLREVDRRLKLTAGVAAVLADPRDPDLIIHPLVDLLRQRIYGIVQGYEDLNDHERLREDALLQSVLERDESLGSAPTLCRMENRASGAEMWALQRQLPDVPTLAEVGLKDFEAGSWYGVMAPAGTPRDIVARLHGELVNVCKLPEIQQRITELGAYVVGNTPEEFSAQIPRERERWAKVA